MRDVRERGNLRPPPALRDASYAGAKRLGHGAGYVYPHDRPEEAARQQYLPDELAGRATTRRTRPRRSQDPGSQRRAGQLDRQAGRLVVLVEHRVHLDELERREDAVLRDELHR